MDITLNAAEVNQRISRPSTFRGASVIPLPEDVPLPVKAASEPLLNCMSCKRVPASSYGRIVHTRRVTYAATT